MSVVAPGRPDQLRSVARLFWPHLPVLLVGSVPVAATWSLLRALPPGLGWLSVAGVGLVVLPVLATLVHGCQLLLDDESFGLPELVPAMVRSFGPAVRVTVAPTAAVLLTLVAFDLWRLSHQGWMLASVAAGGGVAAVAVLVGVVALPYRLRTGTSGRQVWLVSCYIASRNLVPVLGVVSSLALAVWAAAHLSFALVVLLPAPLALIWAAAVTAATRRSQDRLDAHAARPA